MAQRRMITEEFTKLNEFRSVSLLAQRLYFFLLVNADDDGFVSGISHIIKGMDGKMSQVKELCDNGLAIMFKSNSIVLTHFKLMNKIPPDRYKQTNFIDELETITIDKYGKYVIKL